MDFGYDYGYQYDYPATYHRSMSDSIFGAILSIWLIVLTLVIIFTLVSYIFHSIGLYTIGKRLGKAHPWLAFVPFARDYFHGELAGEIRLKSKSVKNPGIWKLLLPIGFDVVLGIFTVLLVLAGIVSTIGPGTGAGIMAMISLYVILIILTAVYSAVYMALRIFIGIQIYERFTTHNMGIVHAVLSVTIPLYEAICLFVMRNKDFIPGMEPRLTPPPVPPVQPIPPTHPEPPVNPNPAVHAEPPVNPDPAVHAEPSVNPDPAVHAEPPVHPASTVHPESSSVSPDLAPEDKTQDSHNPEAAGQDQTTEL